MAKKKSKAKKAAAYYVGSWKGHPNYTCMICPHQTLDQDLFVLHMHHVHGIDFVAEPDPAQEEPEKPAEVNDD